jgi:metal-responsive CopG/Arc/MetJ family transcriptional regulator
MPAAKERKSKFTASVNERIVASVDEHAAKLKLSRSDIVEEAMKMWLKTQVEQEDEKYFSSAAAEMNADAEDWNARTSRSIKDNWKQ